MLRGRSLKLATMLVVSALAVVLQGCGGSRKPTPMVSGGQLDLREWSFEVDGPVRLDGEWEFAWGRLADPSVPTAVWGDSIRVPGVWNGHATERGPAPGMGFATYRLTVLLPERPGALALRIKDAATALAVYANGIRVASSGDPGVTRASSRPAFRPQVAQIPAAEASLVLMVHVSNFHHRSGGLWESLVLGAAEQVGAIQRSWWSATLALLGFLVAMGLYHGGMALFRPSDRSALYFGLFCLLMAARGLTTGERILSTLLPGLGFELVSKIAYLSFYLVVPVLFAYVRTLFPQEASVHVARGAGVVSVAVSVFVLIAPARLYSHTVVPFQVFTVAACVYGLYVSVAALRHARRGSALFLAAFLVFFLAAINDMLYARVAINTFYTLPFSVAVFVLFQSFLLSFRLRDAQRSLEEATQIVNASPAVVFRWGNEPEWPVEFVSDNVVDLLGYTKQELMGGEVPFVRVFHPDDFTRVTDEVRCHEGEARRTTLVHRPYRVVTRNGNIKWVEQSTSFQRDREGRAVHLRGIVWDVTDRIEAESALERYRDSLECRVLNRTRELEDARAAAESANHAKTEFVAKMSHELRTPLTHVLGFTEVVASGQAGELNQLQREYLGDVLGSGHLLMSLINELLDMARMEAGKEVLELGEVSIYPLIDIGLTVVRRQAEAAGVELHAEIPPGIPSLRGDERRLRQILQNLLANAVKFTAAGGRVSVRAAVSDGLLEIRVSDTGEGIAAGDIDRIFEPFYQVVAASRGRPAGTGLGLSIARGLAQLHGGTLRAESAGLGRGSTFCLTLPLAEWSAIGEPPRPG